MLPTILPLQVITTLLAIPGLGESKARTLLKNFGSIEAVATASEADLSLAIGSSAARAAMRDTRVRKLTVKDTTDCNIAIIQPPSEVKQF